MAPAIRRSIGQGFQAANRSWPGMGVYAGGWGLIFAVAVLGLLVTGVPREAVEGPQGGERPSVDQTAGLDDTATPDTAADPAAAAIEDPAAEPPDPEDDAQAAMADWTSRAWPVLALLGLLTLAASTWLYAGQIAYMASRVRGQAATVAIFVSGATAAFGRLLATSLLMLAAVGATGLIIVAAGLMLGALPETVSGVLGGILLAAATAGVVWLMVRAAFWFIAVVADGRGPVAGLKASLAVTKGKWLKTFGLLASLFGIALAALVVSNLLTGIAEVLGGPGGLALQVVVTILQVVVLNLYFGFAFIAASIRYYEDAKAPPAQAS